MTLYSPRQAMNIKQIDFSFPGVFPVIDHEFRHNIVKGAVDPPGDPQTTLKMLWRNSLSITRQTISARKHGGQLLDKFFHLFGRHHSESRILKKDGEFSKWLLSPLDQKSFQEKVFKEFTNSKRNGYDRGDWLWSPANIKEANKDAKIYVGRSTTVHNLLFCVHTLCMSYVIKTFLLVSSPVSSKQLSCFVHGQGQKREQEHTTRNFYESHNHSPLLTMVTLIAKGQIYWPKFIFLQTKATHV